MDHDPLLRISDNDKPESLSCDEDAERVECGLKMSVLMPDIISICFTQPATVDLSTALCGFMKLTDNWDVWFFSLHIYVLSIQQSKGATTHNALSDGNA